MNNINSDWPYINIFSSPQSFYQFLLPLYQLSLEVQWPELSWVLKDTKIISSFGKIYFTPLILCFVYMTPVDTLQQAPRILASVGNKLSQVHLQLTWLECPPWTVAESFPVFSINLWNLLFVVSFCRSWSSLLHSHWFSQFQYTAADVQECLPIYIFNQFWILRVFYPH